MKLPPVLRRPGKLILCALLLTATAGAALLFALQAQLDGLTLEHSMDAYAYVGTVTYGKASVEESTPSGKSLTASALAVLDEELLSAIQDSPYVTSFDTRTTRAGLLEDIFTVPDRMITTARLKQHHFLEATVIAQLDSEELPSLVCDWYTLRLEQQWGGDIRLQNSLQLTLYRSAEDTPLEKGDRIFLIGSYMADGNGVRTDRMSAYTGAGAALSGKTGLLDTCALTVIPEEADSTQSITKYMETTGLLPLYEAYCAMDKAVTVREVSDQMMHPHFSSGRIFLESGRAIQPSDRGEKVCVISQGISIRNRLNVGDTIRLALADGCYTTAGLSPAENGWESGLPMETEAPLSYGDFAEYEIVGVFSQISRDIKDPLFLDQNDIFIPAGNTAAGDVRSYHFSFRVEGFGYEAFQEALQPLLQEKHYRLRLLDTGWDEVEDTFLLLQERRRIMICFAGAAFALAAVLFALLTHRHCRYSYGLRRMLGGTKREAAREYASAFCLSGLAGMAAAVSGVLLAYTLWMRQAMAQVLPTALPTAGQCALLLSQLALAELALAAGILALLCAADERRGLLRLIRR